jgi:replicative DNA helicase
MVVLMAATSRGKTSLALQVATAAAIQSHVPLVWTMEMSPKSLFQRMVTQITGSPSTRRGTSFEERQGQRLAIAQLNDSPVYFDQHSRSVASFAASLRQVRSQTKLGLAVVDYLQLIRGIGGRASRAQEVSDNSRALKLAAMDMGIPFLVLCQVDRSSVKSGGQITLHSGKESGDIENDADVVMWIEAGELSRDLPTTVSLHIGKQREGPAGFSIPMVFSPTSQTFQEVS